MLLFLQTYLKWALAACIFFCELFYIIMGGNFLSSDNLTSVVSTVSLVCHKMASRSIVDLAVVCSRQDPCMAMKTSRDWGEPGMICLCPDGSIWPEVINLTLKSTLHLRTPKNATLPCKCLNRVNTEHSLNKQVHARFKTYIGNKARRYDYKNLLHFMW